MPLDPRATESADPDLRDVARIVDIERRVRALERGAQAMTLPLSAGAPTSTPRDGTAAVDTTNVRLYLRVNGAWRYVALT